MDTEEAEVSDINSDESNIITDFEFETMLGEKSLKRKSADVEGIYFIFLYFFAYFNKYVYKF